MECVLFIFVSIVSIESITHLLHLSGQHETLILWETGYNVAVRVSTVFFCYTTKLLTRIQQTIQLNIIRPESEVSVSSAIKKPP